MDTTEGLRSAIALTTARIHDDDASADAIVSEALADPESGRALVGGLVYLLRLELSFHARERSTTSARLLRDIGEVIAEAEWTDEQPPDDWEGWGPERDGG